MFEEVESKALSFIESRYRDYIRVLGELVAVDTVSAQRSSSEMMKGAQLVSSILSNAGFRTEVRSYGGHPIVVGELGDGPITVLIYNHYDVQPPEPLELWESNPFELVERDGKLYGRGVADNKGNIVARLAAVEALAPYLDELGVKIKWIIEGEEEIGSPTLPKAVEELRDWLRADGGFWETGYVSRKGRLIIPLGFKGMLYVEVIVRGANRDVHSGSAPLVPNPVWRLVKLLSSIKDEDGRILVNWLYDGMIDLGPEAVELLKDIDAEDLEEMKKQLGIERFNMGLEGLEALKHLYLMPSINVSCLYAGYIGKGSKTFIPSIASAKIDIRPVPGQDPERLFKLFKKFLEEKGLGDAEVIVHGAMYPAGYTKPSEDIVKASAKTAEKVYGTRPQLIPLSAGSGPYYYIANYVGTPLTGAGVGHYDSRVHAPNENIRIEDFVKSMKHVALTIIEFARTRQSSNNQ